MCAKQQQIGLEIGRMKLPEIVEGAVHVRFGLTQRRKLKRLSYVLLHLVFFCGVVLVL